MFLIDMTEIDNENLHSIADHNNTVDAFTQQFDESGKTFAKEV